MPASARFQWTAPTEGSPVNYYHVEVTNSPFPGYWVHSSTVNVTDVTQTVFSTMVEAVVDGPNWVRVIAYDNWNREGPPSERSEEWNAAPLPGQPGTPVNIGDI